MSRYLLSVRNASGFDDLYATDGTVAGTVNLGIASIDPGFSLGSALVEFAGRAFFLGYEKADGSPLGGLYATDGTPEGTSQVLFIGENQAEDGVWIVGGALIVSGSVPRTGTPVIYASADGASFTQIATGIAASGLVVSHGIGYFEALGQSGTDGLWRTNGTQAGTFALSSAGLTPTDMIQVGSGLTVFINQTDASSGALWVTDGTVAGTQPLAPGLGLAVRYTFGIATTGPRAVFTAIDAAGNISVWGTDGTEAGTRELLVNGPSNAMIRTPGGFVQLGANVLFDTGYGLVATDGTPGGTVAIASGATQGATVAGGQAFFFDAETPAPSFYVTDGTVAGTHAIQLPGNPQYNLSAFAAGNDLIYTGTDAFGQPTVYQTDGTVAGTEALSLDASINPNALIYAASLPGGAGTGVVTLPGGAQYYVAATGATVQAGSGSDTIRAPGGAVTVGGSSGQLTFYGGTAASSVTGGSGSATIYGGTGGGQFSGGGAGFNVLIAQGSAGVTTAMTGAGSRDEIFGSSAGDDVLTGGPGRDSIIGGGGNTTIYGGDSADVIFTGAGASRVNGGTGAGDTIVGGGGGLAVTARNGDAIFGGAGSVDVTASLSGADSIVAGSGALTVAGRGANMLVVAGSGRANVTTGNGASLVYAGSGNLSLVGGSGSMQVLLGAGSSSIIEGAGAVTLEVAKGAAGGADIVTGFRPGTDHIQLYGYTPAQQQVTAHAGSTIIALSDGSKITLVGVTNAGGSIVG